MPALISVTERQAMESTDHTWDRLTCYFTKCGQGMDRVTETPNPAEPT